MGHGLAALIGMAAGTVLALGLSWYFRQERIGLEHPSPRLTSERDELAGRHQPAEWIPGKYAELPTAYHVRPLDPAEPEPPA